VKPVSKIANQPVVGGAGAHPSGGRRRKQSGGRMCSRIKYQTGTETYIVGRSMDWNDPTAKTRLWILPKGINRDGGGGGPKSVTWTSKYGSIGASLYDIGAADGMNEAGLVANMLYLAESDFGDPIQTGKPTIHLGAWLQYYLDLFPTVVEAVEAMADPPFTVVAPTLPNGRASTVHLSLSDVTGDSAILEFLDGELVIHHGPQFSVMTNSPIYEQQLALNAYWDLIGGNNMLPGTISAADRFVRLSYNLKSSPKYADRDMAVASVFSQVRAISVPLGMADPVHPNISATLWRSVSDQDARRYYFEMTTRPAVFWVDMDKVDLAAGAPVKAIDVDTPEVLFGEISAKFEPAEPLTWV
jgi:penicillin V acylase-like amidase (Ntn superfamily)